MFRVLVSRQYSSFESEKLVAERMIGKGYGAGSSVRFQEQSARLDANLYVFYFPNITFSIFYSKISHY